MTKDFQAQVQSELQGILAAGTDQREFVNLTPQDSILRVADGLPVLNLCANSYLGPALMQRLRGEAAAAEVAQGSMA